jgi:hypothetical protein
VAALLAPRPPDLLVLNEPETSPRRRRSRRADVREITLIKEFGETQIAGRSAVSAPAWYWPRR